MQFEFSDDQGDLQQMLRAFLEHHGTSAAVREAAERNGGFAPSVWKRLTEELELTGIAVDPDHGGTFLGVDGKDLPGIREAHLDDVFVPVDPGGLAARLAAAGFAAATIEDGDGTHFRFHARKRPR